MEKKTLKNIVSSLQIPAKLTLTRNLANLLYSLSKKATKMLHGDRATIYVFRKGTQELVSYVASELEIDEIRLKKGEGIAGKVADSLEGLIVNDVEECSYFNPFFDSQTNYKTRNLITAPLLNENDELIGVIQVLNKKVGLFTQEDMGTLNILGSVAAIAIEQAQVSHENQILKEYNRQLIQNFNAGILVVDREGKIQDCNQKFIKMFQLEDNIEDHDLRLTSPSLYHAISEDLDTHKEIKLRDRFYQICVSDLNDNDNHSVGTLALITDITEKIQERNAKELEERMSILGRMSSQIVHDIKNPLFVIRGYIKLIASAENLSDIQRYLLTMEQEVTRILDITQEILDFSRGDVDINASKYDTASVNTMILELSQKMGEIFDFSINCILDNHHPELKLRADMGKLERALRNILTNSLEAFKDHDNIQVEIESHLEENNLVIYIKDNGGGIPPEIKDLVFQPFVTYHKKKGTGLGLPIARAIIERHDGDIKLDKLPGWETVFKISLPLYK